MKQTRARAATARGVGRPRRLSDEQVLDAALELGLDGLTMTAVAERLGVSVTVLYSYVANREDLVYLAALRAAQKHRYPEDVGQDWRLYVSQFARALFEQLIGPGQLITRLLHGGLGPEVEVDRAESWLAALTSRGFSAEAALRLQRQMSEIVMGAAVNLLHVRAIEAAGEPFLLAARKAVEGRPDGEAPLLRGAVDAFSARPPVWEASLALLVQAAAAERGERAGG